MSLDIRALIPAHAGEASAHPEAHVNPRLAKALRLIGFDRAHVRGSGPCRWDDKGWRVQLETPLPCGLLAQELERRCGPERLSRGSSPQRKATA